ncbi:MAG: lactate/malate family dehydrogenase [Pyrinomonadaceae bacterium]
MQINFTETTRVALIGCSDIDPFDVLSMIKSGRPDELVLIGEGNKILAEKLDSLVAKSNVSRDFRLFPGDPLDSAGADIAIVSTSVPEVGKESPAEHLRRTANAVRHEVRSLVDAGFEGVMLVTTSPIDLMSFVARDESQFASERVIGLGSNVDYVARLSLYSTRANTWCSGMSFDPVFLDHCDPICPHFESVVRKTSSVHLNDFDYGGNRTCGMATCVARICQAIMNDEREIFPVSAYMQGEYDEYGIFMTAPCIIGRNGIERIVKLPITANEKLRIQAYAAELRNLLAELQLPSYNVASAN